MRILIIGKYPPIQGGVSADNYWTAQLLAEMGHEVHVLTNADEVESDYRIAMNENDERKLRGFSKPNSVTLYRTEIDARHVFIPQTNPSVSKLLSLGLEIIATNRPDFIWAHYLEPYGVVAYLLSTITKVPYVFRHAGSDIGRLMLTEQLATLHKETLRNASLILTNPRHHDRFTAVGVESHRLAKAVPTRMRGDLFFPTEFSVDDELRLGIYGKMGKSKGTDVLAKALTQLAHEDFPFAFRSHWGGRHLPDHGKAFAEAPLAGRVELGGFIPHWRIPDFIRSVHAILFLEHRFSITFHQPGVPLEVLACGRPVITTEEIAEKPLYRDMLKDGTNAFIVKGDVMPNNIADTIRRAFTTLRAVPSHLFFPVAQSDVGMRVQMYELLEHISLVTGAK